VPEGLYLYITLLSLSCVVPPYRTAFPDFLATTVLLHSYYGQSCIITYITYLCDTPFQGSEADYSRGGMSPLRGLSSYVLVPGSAVEGSYSILLRRKISLLRGLAPAGQRPALRCSLYYSYSTVLYSFYGL
jgi:hypothetical protein